MQLSRFLFFLALLLLPVCLVSTTWLYFYPLFHGCSFPTPNPSHHDHDKLRTIRNAPFRLLALGDPQLEGDSSLPDPDALTFPSLQYLVTDLKNSGSWSRRRYFLSEALREFFSGDIPTLLEGYRKRIDLWGNDLYLAHIVRQLRWWTQPTHVAVLGDLLGSQWITDQEFERRAARYWSIVFRGMERVENEMMEDNEVEGKRWGGSTQILGQDEEWKTRLINIAGNHDVGYAGDLDEGRIRRFEKAFGKVNWDIVFTLPPTNATMSSVTEEQTDDQQENRGEPPALRLVILNSMNLDTPAFVDDLQRSTYDYLNHIITTSRPVTSKTHTTILLTHIPLHKEKGICVDEPFFDFFDTGSGVKEQNMLSTHVSKMLLEGVFGLSGDSNAEGHGLGRHGVIINGHDHEGCDVWHYTTKREHECPDAIDLLDDAYTAPANASEPPDWSAIRSSHSTSLAGSQLSASSHLDACIASRSMPSLREITLRSMMGDFGGYAGFLSAWFDEGLGEEGEWRIEFARCGVGVQHWWWAVHIVDLVFLVILILSGLVYAVETLLRADKKELALSREEKSDVRTINGRAVHKRPRS